MCNLMICTKGILQFLLESIFGHRVMWCHTLVRAFKWLPLAYASIQARRYFFTYNTAISPKVHDVTFIASASDNISSTFCQILGPRGRFFSTSCVKVLYIALSTFPEANIDATFNSEITAKRSRADRLGGVVVASGEKERQSSAAWSVGGAKQSNIFARFSRQLSDFVRNLF